MKIIKVKNFLKIGDDYYLPDVLDEKTGEWNFIKLTKKEVARINKMRNDIIAKAAPAVLPEQVLDDALSDLPLEELEGIHHNLFKAKRKAKPRTEPGCLELRIGKYTIPIRS